MPDDHATAARGGIGQQPRDGVAAQRLRLHRSDAGRGPARRGLLHALDHVVELLAQNLQRRTHPRLQGDEFNFPQQHPAVGLPAMPNDTRRLARRYVPQRLAEAFLEFRRADLSRCARERIAHGAAA